MFAPELALVAPVALPFTSESWEKHWDKIGDYLGIYQWLIMVNNGQWNIANNHG